MDTLKLTGFTRRIKLPLIEQNDKNLDSVRTEFSRGEKAHKKGRNTKPAKQTNNALLTLVLCSFA